MKKPQNIYDNSTFYKEYSEMRTTNLNANELIEIPIIKSMLPDLKGKKVLDLGCGNGTMSRYFIEQGACEVLALDISQNMINEAKEKNNLEGITYIIDGMENLDKINDKFDLVFSSLAFHYIEDFNKLMKDINNLLNDNGILLFSQEHPTVTASILNKDEKKYVTIGDTRYFYLNNYNNNGKRIINWNVDGVVKYHRNFSTTINTILNNNFELLQINESTASKEAIALVEKYKYQKDRPYFLFVKAKKR